jgi:hypothetical protein
MTIDDQKVKDICVITTFFNPEDYKTKLDNFYIFHNHLAALPIICVEALYKKTKHQIDPQKLSVLKQNLIIPETRNIIKIKGKDVLWQKEAMLNIALKSIPKKYTKIIWIDCDIIFESLDWINQTSKLLNSYNIIQPFKEVVRLPKGKTSYNKLISKLPFSIRKWPLIQKYFGNVYTSFGFEIQNNPSTLTSNNFELHGHTGFVWAAKRKIFQKHGFYTACVAGSADHMMAHAFAGDFHSGCIRRHINGEKYFNHFLKWSEKIYKDIRCKISYTPGRILHIWHGDIRDRRYVLRNQELCKLKFDPNKDIKKSRNGLLEWTKSGNRKFNKWAKSYFKNRKEDG